MTGPGRGDRLPLEVSQRQGRTRAMSTYVMLAKWTDQGIRSIADAPKRMEAAKKLLA